MHIDVHLRRKHVMALVGAVVLLVVAGTAYATIPDGNGVYTACKLNGLGTIRLIDPSGPSSSWLSHCTNFETQVSWSQKGPKGDTGAAGASPTVQQLLPGDSNCPTGGAEITDATNPPAYVCNGQSFSGTFTSPNHQFSLSVTDYGIELSGPGGRVSIKSDRIETVANAEYITIHGSRDTTIGNDETLAVQGNRTETVGNDQTITVQGNRTVTIQGNRTETVGHDEQITIHGSRDQTVDKNETISVQGDRTETVGNLGLRATGALNFVGSLVGINQGTSGCRRVARVDDVIDPITFMILTGSPTVCIG